MKLECASRLIAGAGMIGGDLNDHLENWRREKDRFFAIARGFCGLTGQHGRMHAMMRQQGPQTIEDGLFSVFTVRGVKSGRRF
jgi:hypothetical protein